jgi:hypothetical protein
MSDQPPATDPIEQWVGDLLSGTLSHREREQLAARLHAAPAARRLYVEHLMLHGMLQWEFASSAGVVAEGALGRRAARWPALARNLVRVGLAAAAVLMIAAVGLWRYGPWAPVAVLRDVQGASWTGTERQPGVGAGLGAQTLRLAAGVAELGFRGGAAVILQGPAELQLISATRARLLSGRMVARAPDGAHGFTIEAGGMDIVDLGTEFGVVNNNGAAEVQVFEGVVEAGVRGAALEARSRLGIGQAARLGDGAAVVEAVGFSTSGFMRAMASELDDPALTRGVVAWWKFDETSGTVAADATGNGHAGVLHGCTFDHDGEAGKYGRALRLNGNDSYVAVPFKDFNLVAMTIQAWIKPGDQQGGDAQIISQVGGFGLAVPRNLFMKYYFWDRDAIMACRFEPEHWYHLVATYDGRERGFFVDGVRIGTFSSGPLCPSRNELRIGALGYGQAGFFRGCIDDLRIYDRALSADEVRRLYLRGTEIGK